MLTSLQTRLKKAGRLLPFALLPFAANAQSLNYTPATATNVAGTYTNLGTTGTAITTANTDDANSAATPIGFTFAYNGSTFNQFVLNTNGFIRLGAVAPSGTVLFPSQVSATIVDPLTSGDPADVNLLLPFNQDLGPGNGAGGTEYRVTTTGTAGSQVCTIQWNNVSDKTDGVAPSQYANFSFQLKLYEGTNLIEFVYNTATAGTGAAGPRFPNVGIKGAGVANGQTVLAAKNASATPWSGAIFITGSYTTFTLNYRANVGPDAGRTFRYTPAILYPNDLAVQSLYTLGTVSTYASPVAVRALIKNVGTVASVARTATLTVSGATSYTNTQPVPALAVGAVATVTFAAYPVIATTGTNTVAVALTADDAAGNNTATRQQGLSASTLSYNTPGTTTFDGGFGSNTTANATIFVKYTTSVTPTTVTAVTPIFAGTAANSTNYQVLVYDATGPNGLPGTVLYTSPTRVRPLAGGADVVAIPGVPVSGSFYVAARQLTTTNFGLAFQNEDPLRTGTFFISTDGIAFTDLAVANTTFRAAIDVTLRNPLATRNEALAATVGLYPNPAHQSFQLSVPAGSLRGASATLINSLGQVVQSRQLDLPAAGGIAIFNVSSLAAGVYSLALKSGNDLVVKRVVVE